MTMDAKAPSIVCGPDKEAAKLLTVLIDLTHAPVSSEERRLALTTIGDTLGVMLAGACDVRARQLLATMSTSRSGRAGLSQLPGGRIWAAPADVALVLGFSAHLLDFDDDETEIAMAHLSAPCLPAALAVAGIDGEGSRGVDLLDAYVTGCQVMLAVGSAVNPSLYKAGWHATSVLGAFGATAAAARLFRLTEGQTAHAFGLVSALASGPRGSFGGEGKPLQVAQAASSGVRAAQLAGLGWTAPPGAFAGERGVLTRMVGTLKDANYDVQEAFPPSGFVTKPYPSCTATHAAVAEVLAIMARAEGHGAGSVRSLHCGVDPFVPQILIPHMPVSADEGRFSLSYCLAVAAVHGDLAPSAFAADVFSPQGPCDADVLAMMSRVVVSADDGLPKGPSGISTGACIRIEWEDGFTLEGRRDAGPGSRLSPLSDTELRTKFRLCLADTGTAEDPDMLWQRILTLADVPSAGAFIGMLPSVFKPQGQD
jgi:Uncharacterized protein involved in propionate catabolism